MLRLADEIVYAFIRAQSAALNVSCNRADDHSQIDHAVAMPSPTVGAERSVAWPGREQLVAQRPRDPHASLQRAFPHGELPGPPAEAVLASQLMDRRFDEDP